MLRERVIMMIKDASLPSLLTGGGTFALSGPARRLRMTGIPPTVAASAELLPGAGQRLVPPIHARDAALPAEEEGAFLWVRV